MCVSVELGNGVLEQLEQCFFVHAPALLLLLQVFFNFADHLLEHVHHRLLCLVSVFLLLIKQFLDLCDFVFDLYCHCVVSLLTRFDLFSDLLGQLWEIVFETHFKVLEHVKPFARFIPEFLPQTVELV